MKDNRQFLEGVYKKAEMLEIEKREQVEKNRRYKKYRSIASMAAAIAIIVPIFLFQGPVPRGYKQLPQMVKMIHISDPMMNFQEADYIISGKTKNIGEGQYIEGRIYTDITIEIQEIFLGDIEKKEITLRVNGGKVKKEKLFAEMDGEFKKGKTSLLFLQEEEGIYYLVNQGEGQFLEVESNVFKDKDGNKYNIENIKNNIDRR